MTFSDHLYIIVGGLVCLMIWMISSDNTKIPFYIKLDRLFLLFFAIVLVIIGSILLIHDFLG